MNNKLKSVSLILPVIMLLIFFADAFAAPLFTDISDVSGMRKNNFIPGAKNIPINDHSRIRSADINSDGYTDLIANSLFPNPLKGIPFETLVFINNGDGTFTDFSDESGLRTVQCAFYLFADFDNDGDQDAFAGLDIPLPGVLNNQILLNDGRGHFTPLENSGVELSKNLNTANACAADFDNDGILDLFVGNGSSIASKPDMLFKGLGGGYFKDINYALPDMKAHPTNGCITLDFDNDGDQDIFVTTYGVSVEKGHDFLWENLGGMKFKNSAYSKGVAAQLTGNYWNENAGKGNVAEPGKRYHDCMGGNSFGPAVNDFNNDGNLDILVAQISHLTPRNHYERCWSDPSLLLINLGARGNYSFVNQFQQRKLQFNEGDVNASAVDFDNDGRVDAAFSRDKKYERNFKEFDQKGWFGLFRQTDDGSFESVGETCGINSPIPGTLYSPVRMAQNHCWLDIEHDGDLDLFIGGRDLGGGRPNFLFRNDSSAGNKFIAFKVSGDGKRINRDGIGTRITIQTDTGTFTRECVSSRGNYCDQDSRWLHFGLGKSTRIRNITVRWPDRSIQKIKPSLVRMGRFYTIESGKQPVRFEKK